MAAEDKSARTQVYTWRVTLDRYHDTQAIQVLESASPRKHAAIVRRLICYALDHGAVVADVPSFSRAPASKKPRRTPRQEEGDSNDDAPA